MITPLRDLILIKRHPETTVNGIWRESLVYDRDKQQQAKVLNCGPKVKDVAIGDEVCFKLKDVYFQDTDQEMIAESNVLYGIAK